MSGFVDRGLACVSATGCRLILMQGIPGSGKTMVANALKAKIKNLVVVCADDEFTTSEGYKFDASRMKEVHLRTQEKAREALAGGSIVLVDNCNYLAFHATPYLNMLSEKKNDCAVALHLRSMTRGEALSFGERSPHSVPDYTVIKMHDKMERIESSIIKIHYVSHPQRVK